MVCEWGMSEKLGPLTFGRKEEEIFLGREIATKRDFSEQVALEIDHEIKRLVSENYERAKRILTENMVSLKALAQALLEKEVLDALEIDQIIMQGSASQTVPALTRRVSLLGQTSHSHNAGTDVRLGFPHFLPPLHVIRTPHVLHLCPTFH